MSAAVTKGNTKMQAESSVQCDANGSIQCDGSVFNPRTCTSPAGIATSYHDRDYRPQRRHFPNRSSSSIFADGPPAVNADISRNCLDIKKRHFREQTSNIFADTPPANKDDFMNQQIPDKTPSNIFAGATPTGREGGEFMKRQFPEKTTSNIFADTPSADRNGDFIRRQFPNKSASNIFAEPSTDRNHRDFARRQFPNKSADNSFVDTRSPPSVVKRGNFMRRQFPDKLASNIFANTPPANHSEFSRDPGDFRKKRSVWSEFYLR